MPIARKSSARAESDTDILQRGGGIPGFPAAFWSARGAALYHGDVRDCLRRLPARSVHCAVCSPPYFQQRDYGTGAWQGGSAECDHKKPLIAGLMNSSTLDSRANNQNHDQEPWRGGRCGKCGAVRVDRQIGMESSPDCGTRGQAQCGDCFVCSMVGVFREVYRVLRDDGTLWLNLGDTFVDGQQGMVPARVALALQADGWLLRQDIIWYSANKMPESVENRCGKAHEHIFLLAKSSDYYFDHVAIQEPSKSVPHTPGRVREERVGQGSGGDVVKPDKVWAADGWVNKRDVWVVPTRGYAGAHFAVYSPQLITPCILASTSEHGCCAQCGRPWERVVVKTGVSAGLTGGEYAPPGQTPHSNARGDDNRDRSFEWSRNGKEGTGSTLDTAIPTKQTVGWRKVCGCSTNDVVPAVVMDPFVGSGTTVATAMQLGRYGVGIDLSETYLRENAIPRISEATFKVEDRKTVALVEAEPPAAEAIH